MSQPKRYVKRPVECEAMKLDGYGSFIRALDWINENGGRAYFTQGPVDVLKIVTIDGNIADVFEGWYVVQGIAEEFYPCRGDIFEASHSLVEEPVVAEPPSPGVYEWIHNPDGSTRLVGGAALKLDSEDQ